MTKTEYTIAITANQTAISNVRADLRKLRNIEKLAKSFPEPQKLVDFDMLDATISAKKTELQKFRSELGKARRIVKRMNEIEDIEAGKFAEKKAKKSAGDKKATGTADKKAADKAGKKIEGKTTRAKKLAAEKKSQPPVINVGTSATPVA